jgi:hypothetical protein
MNTEAKLKLVNKPQASNGSWYKGVADPAEYAVPEFFKADTR